MQQMLPQCAVQVRPIMQRVHLMNSDALEASSVRLDGIEHRDRLAVGERNDHVGAVRDELEDILCPPGCWVGRTPAHRHKNNLGFARVQ